MHPSDRKTTADAYRRHLVAMCTAAMKHNLWSAKALLGLFCKQYKQHRHSAYTPAGGWAQAIAYTEQWIANARSVCIPPYWFVEALFHPQMRGRTARNLDQLANEVSFREILPLARKLCRASETREETERRENAEALAYFRRADKSEQEEYAELMKELEHLERIRSPKIM